MSKSKAEATLLTSWNLQSARNYKLISQHRPQRIAYDAEITTLGYRAWLKENNFSDFRLDFFIAFPEDHYLNGLGIELQGLGGNFGHKGAGQIRDFQKNIQMLKFKIPTICFASSTVTKTPKYAIDEILGVLDALGY